MELTSPIIITPRLMPGVQIGDGIVSIEYKDITHDGRMEYQWYVDIGVLEVSSDDLCSGVGGGSLQEGLESFLAFLGAFAESWQYAGENGENSNLFPATLAEWAMQNSDEIGMLQIELDETEGLIDE